MGGGGRTQAIMVFALQMLIVLRDAIDRKRLDVWGIWHRLLVLRVVVRRPMEL